MLFFTRCFLPATLIIILGFLMLYRIRVWSLTVHPQSNLAINTIRKCRNTTVMLIMTIFAFVFLTVPTGAKHTTLSHTT